MLRIVTALIAAVLLCAQTPMLPGFPPGTFQSRAALDASAAVATCASVLPNLLINLDASNASSVIKSGANVSAWNDLSGNGNNFTATNSPQYSATGFPGSKPGVTFTKASSQYLTSTSSTIGLNSTALSVFVVLTYTASSAGNDGIVSILGVGQAADYNNSASLSISNSPPNYSVTRNFGGSPQYNVTLGGAQVANAASFLGAVFDGVNGTNYVDLNTGTPASSTGTFGATTASFSVGARLISTPSNFMDGIVSEVIVTTGTVSGGALTTLHSCLSAKWGVP